MFKNVDETVKPKKSCITTPSTPSTPSTQQKRGLTSPDCPLDLKKNKVYLSPGSETTELFESEMSEDGATAMDGATGVSITLRECDIQQIAGVLKNTFRDELREELTKTVKDIIDGVISGLSANIKTLTDENVKLKKENTDLRTRVDKIETAAEAAEQYSRRNCIRVSGIPEEEGEDTDGIVLHLARAMDVELNIEEIDRSHRVGKPKNTKTRDIIVKLATFRVRQRLLKDRKNLKTTKYGDGRYKGVYVNEDLTRFRSGILFDARKLAKERRIYSAWSSNGTILLKDNTDTVHKISKDADLVPFRTAEPRPPEPQAAGHMD